MSAEGSRVGRRPSHVVGIGASAGGLEALEKVFRNMPSDTGMAFVVVQHLSTEFKSMMSELLGRCTPLEIRKVKDGMPVEQDTIYLVPPGKEMIIQGGQLLLTDRDPDEPLALPIDHFLRALAQDQGPNAIGVILSGTGSDGSRGIVQVHANGGLVICQSPDTAKFDGMPRSARDSGAVDLFLNAEDIPQALLRYRENPDRERLVASVEATPIDRDGLSGIYRQLRSAFGLDFSYYKPATIERRLRRRLTLGRSEDLDAYARRLQEDRDELDALFRDLLIGVTRFMRDPDGFRNLVSLAIDPTLEKKKPRDELRIWAAGCATGEEAYSLALLVRERMEALGRHPRVKIFATDVHRDSIDIASRGEYGADALEELEQGWIERYFTKTPTGYQVASELRQMIVFAPHDVIRDAPFTKLDLVTCRNLLIYLQPIAQKKALSLFHFGLRTGGFLFLGPSESPGALDDEFETVHAHWKLYRKRRDIRLPTDLRLAPRERSDEPGARRLSAARGGGFHSIRGESRLIGFYDSLLGEAMPAALLVDQDRTLLHKFGGAGRFLREDDGRVSIDLFDRLDPRLRPAVSSGFHRVLRDRRPFSYRAVPVTVDGEERTYRLVVKPVHNERDGSDAVLVEFHPERFDGDEPTPASPSESASAPVDSDRMRDLESELRYTRENLQATIEELETANEELQASNEELVASNEELQSTNEELNSVNEELYTVNAEHQQQIGELTELTNDMENLLQSTQVHTLFLDRELHIRKFTPRSAALFHLVPHDVGRRFDSFKHTIEYGRLIEDLRAVVDGGTVIEREVQDAEERWYFARLLPYLVDGRVEGVVITLVDISALKRAQQMFHIAFEATSRPMLMSDARGSIVLTNRAAQSLFGHDEGSFLELSVDALVPEDGRDDVESGFLAILRDPEGTSPVAEPGVTLRRRDGTTFQAAVTVNPVHTERGWFALASVRDETEEQRMKRLLREKEAQLQGVLDNASAAIYMKDLRGRFLLVNSACAELLGVPAGEAVGRSTHDILPRETADEHVANDREVIRTGTLRRVEESLDDLTFLTVKFPVRDADGQVFAVGGISTDISEQKDATTRAELAVEQRDRFLAMLSHELRNPLAAMTSAMQLLDREPRPPARERLERVIRQQAEQLRRLLDDLLDVARVSEGKINLHRDAVDLREVARLAVESMDDAFGRRRQTIELEVADEPLVVDGDPARLQQIVVNLLSNANRFSDDGSAVRVRVQREGGDVALTIRDEGIGIASEAIDSIFELFAQVDDSPDRREGGLGIGLTLVRQLAHLHGGEVTARSDGPGEGSEFTVRLPLVAAQPERPASEPVRGIHRVVVVDDNVDLALLTADVLRDVGFEVMTAHDGVEALRLIETFRPEAVVLDIGLPKLNGLEVASRLRAEDEYASLLLVGISGYGQERDIRRSEAAGFDHHLVKPFDQDELVRLLGATPREVADQPRAPSAGAPPTSSMPAEGGETGETGRVRLLLVEDHDVLRDMTRETLEQHGYDVHTARDGEEALNLAASVRPDVVLCDWRLPGAVGGCAVGRRLRDELGAAGVVLVALSAHSAEAYGDQARACGFDAFLSKPLELEDLERIVAGRRAN